MLILAQMPSFHSLRHINLISLLLCLAYSAAATAASIYIGKSSLSSFSFPFYLLFLLNPLRSFLFICYKQIN